MASIAIMIGGAIINAAAFTGGNYLAQYLSGGGKAALAEKTCHDKALQKYQDIFAMTYKVLCLTASSSITKHKIFITRAQIGSMLGMILLTYLSVLTYFREIVYI